MPDYVEPGICVIEHPARGVLVDLPGERDEKAHFAWSLPRYQGKHLSQSRAREVLKDLPTGCYVILRTETGWVIPA